MGFRKSIKNLLKRIFRCKPTSSVLTGKTYPCPIDGNSDYADKFVQGYAYTPMYPAGRRMSRIREIRENVRPDPGLDRHSRKVYFPHGENEPTPEKYYRGGADIDLRGPGERVYYGQELVMYNRRVEEEKRLALAIAKGKPRLEEDTGESDRLMG